MNFVVHPHAHNMVRVNLLIGNGVHTPADVALLQRAEVTHVLDCREDAEAFAWLYAGSGIAHCAAPAEDGAAHQPVAWFRRGLEFARDALVVRDNLLLVHCLMGVQRGPSMAYAVLRMQGCDAEYAQRLIRRARPLVSLAYMQDAERALAELGLLRQATEV